MNQIRVKKTLQPIEKNEYIYFGWGNPKLERRISNTEENKNLIKKLDAGQNDFLINSEEKKVIAEWKNLGLLTLNQYEDTRYSRNINFFEWIDVSSETDHRLYQEKLKKSTVLIVGLGGIGGTLSEILVRLGVGNFILIDFDVVEESNLTRQSVYTSQSVGIKKIFECKSYLENLVDEVSIITEDKEIKTKNDLEDIFCKYNFDIAICCADKPRIEIDYWFDDIAHKYNKKYIIGSYASTVVNYVCIKPGDTLSLREFYGENMIDTDSILGESPMGIIAPVSYMSAALIANKVFQELTKLNIVNEAIQIDLLDWSVYKYELERT